MLEDPEAGPGPGGWGAQRPSDGCGWMRCVLLHHSGKGEGTG